MNWSGYQTAIFDAFTNTTDSLLIEAVAGSGKTRTLEELARIMGERFASLRGVMVAFNKSIAMELQSRIDRMAGTVPMSMSDKLRRASEAGLEPRGGELFARMKPNVQAMTLHSAGWSAWRRAGGLDWEPRVDSLKVHKIMREVLSYEEVKRFGETTRKLVAAAKGIGLVPAAQGRYEGQEYIPSPLSPIAKWQELCGHGLVSDTTEAWESLIDHYGLDEDECRVDCARRVLARGIELAKETCDFDDMLYMPVIAGVPFDRYDVVLVDEAQDVSGIQMEMIERMVTGEAQNADEWGRRRRVIAVGDRSQAIYGFRGAGTDSMDIFKRRFQMTELPLSVTYRCPKSVVLHSRQWVRQLEWSDTAGDGYVGLEGTDWAGQAEIALGAPLIDHSILVNCHGCNALPESENGLYYCPSEHCREWLVTRDRDSWNKMHREIAAEAEGISKWRGIRDFQPGDAVLCRLTRPLVAAAFAMIRSRIACRVLGRDIGAGLVQVVKKGQKSLQAGTVGEFERWLDDYEQREGQRLTDKGKHAQAGLLGDRCETIRVFLGDINAADPVTGLISDIEKLFVDNGGASGMVQLSTIHKFKGMESDRVFILDAGEFMPVPWGRNSGWELQQEKNLMYVAATRAKRELRYITTSDLR